MIHAYFTSLPFRGSNAQLPFSKYGYLVSVRIRHPERLNDTRVSLWANVDPRQWRISYRRRLLNIGPLTVTVGS
jgi:hypothetical protein